MCFIEPEVLDRMIVQVLGAANLPKEKAEDMDRLVTECEGLKKKSRNMYDGSEWKPCSP